MSRSQDDCNLSRADHVEPEVMENDRLEAAVQLTLEIQGSLLLSLLELAKTFAECLARLISRLEGAVGRWRHLGQANLEERSPTSPLHTTPAIHPEDQWSARNDEYFHKTFAIQHPQHETSKRRRCRWLLYVVG